LIFLDLAGLKGWGPRKWGGGIGKGPKGDKEGVREGKGIEGKEGRAGKEHRGTVGK